MSLCTGLQIIISLHMAATETEEGKEGKRKRKVLVRVQKQW